MAEKSDSASQMPINCEAISIVSGKGGTGKTFIAVCLAYSLQNAGHRVCLIDTDFATQGLSLFLLGKGAERGVSSLKETQSLYHMTQAWNRSKGKLPEPKSADRSYDHGMEYQIILSNKQFYDRRLSMGINEEAEKARAILKESMGETSDEFRKNFRILMRLLVQKLSESGQFDYIVIDTRGGFGELSLIPVVYSNSFLIVTEPDFTSFHQLAKLLSNIDLMAMDEKTNPFIRGVIINKSIDGKEEKFRALLDTQFGIEFGLSWPIPLDQNAILPYKKQLIPFKEHPESLFSYVTLKAFTEIFDIVTVEWKKERKKTWHELLRRVEKEYQDNQLKADQEKNKLIEFQKEFERKMAEAEKEKEKLNDKIKSLEHQLSEEKNKQESQLNETKSLKNQIKSTEVKGFKKSLWQRSLLVVMGVLIIILTIFFFLSQILNKGVSNKQKGEIPTQMIPTEAQSKEQVSERYFLLFSIDSKPAEARVLIDKRLIGKTPLKQRLELSEGVHLLEIKLDGFETLGETLTISEFQKEIIKNFVLKPIYKK